MLAKDFLNQARTSAHSGQQSTPLAAPVSRACALELRHILPRRQNGPHGPLREQGEARTVGTQGSAAAGHTAVLPAGGAAGCVEVILSKSAPHKRAQAVVLHVHNPT